VIQIFYALHSFVVEANFYDISRPLMASSDCVKDTLLLCFMCAGTSHDAEGDQIDVDLETVY